GAVVSRGGRPDLAGPSLPRVRAPVLLIVGGADPEVLRLNEQARRQLDVAELHIVSGATHLFEEPGALEEVTTQAADWFNRHLDHGT
ncbi:MAG TPA: alpha/beta hydrolase, partial [Spirillospora sp.]|nr:alpha/beta hydrolase [Spirillospora sp.]